MAIKIKFNDPRKNLDELPDGVTMTPIKSEYKEHFRVFAQNGDYPDRTELGTVKRCGEGHFVMEVEYKKFAVAGWTAGQKSYGNQQIKDVTEAINSLYAHRLDMKAKGLLK